MAVGTENIVLSLEETLDTTHQASTLTVEIRVDLTLESGLVEVTTSDGNTHSRDLLESLAADVLEDSDGTVDTTRLEEERTNGTAGTLRSAKDNVLVLGSLEAGLLLVGDLETVGEVEGVSVGHLVLNVVVDLGASSVGKEEHGNGSLLAASSMEKRFFPGCQPSSMASFHEAPSFRTPTMTFKPLSRRLCGRSRGESRIAEKGEKWSQYAVQSRTSYDRKLPTPFPCSSAAKGALDANRLLFSCHSVCLLHNPAERRHMKPPMERAMKERKYSLETLTVTLRTVTRMAKVSPLK